MANGFGNSFGSFFNNAEDLFSNAEDYGDTPEEELEKDDGTEDEPAVPIVPDDTLPAGAVPVDDTEQIEYEREMHTVCQKTSTSCDLNDVSEIIKKRLMANSEVPVEEAEDGKTLMFTEEPTYVYNREPDEEAAQKIGVFIDEFKLVFEEYKDMLENGELDDNQTVIKNERVRVYDKDIKDIETKLKKTPSDSEDYKKLKKELGSKIKDKMGLSKVTFAKPKEEKSFGKKLKIAAIVCSIISAFFGIQANSYYNYCVATRKPLPSGIGATFSWLTKSDMPTALMPFNPDIFFAAFGTAFVIVAIVMLLAYSSADTKKRSRVGHEHGAARLGTSTDFKKFKSRFME